jgi:hypothetical protein
MFTSPKTTKNADNPYSALTLKSSMGRTSQKSAKNVPDLPVVQVFEYYFYPEYAIKMDKIKVDDPDKI